MTGMTSIHEVAKYAGVGVGTVSRVINKSGYVSEATREKVENAIRVLNYTPNELARNLYRNRTNNIAVIFPDSQHPFYACLISEIEHCLRVRGYRTMLCNTVGSASNEEAFLDMLRRNMVDGVLTGTHTLDDTVYRKIDRPMVSFDIRPLSARCPVITVNHARGGQMAAEALIKSGCHEVVQFIDDSTVGDYPFLKRHDAFRQMMLEHHVICHDIMMPWNSFALDDYNRIPEETYRTYPEADGVFGVDLLAAMYMKCAIRHGRHVPEDLKVVAYDGVFAQTINVVQPDMTAIVQPIPALAERGVKELLNQIEGKPASSGIVTLKVSFHQGETTTPLEKPDIPCI